MGGLIFFLLTGLWLVLCAYLAHKIPKWLRIKRFDWIFGLFLFPALVVAPVIDDLIGMRQFEQLCKERAVVRLSPEADQVRRATRANLPTVNLQGYWINIRSQPETFIDADTGKVFLNYEILHTKGGRIAGIVMLGGQHSCSPKDTNDMKRLDIDKLLKQGK